MEGMTSKINGRPTVMTKAVVQKLEAALRDGFSIEMAKADPEYKQDIKDEVDKVKGQIADNKQLIQHSGELEEDLLDFVKFGLEYTNTLMDDWWKLDHEERLRCQQLILPGGISFNHDKKVGTPIISPIYSFQANKKDLRFDRKSLMVELPDTASGSVGVYMLVVYKFRLFYCLSGWVSKQTNISPEQSWS